MFGHETWPLAKVPEIQHMGASKLSLFLVYEQRLLRYGLIFKIAIFWHETWPLGGTELIFTLQTAVSEVRGNLLPYLGMTLGH